METLAVPARCRNAARDSDTEPATEHRAVRTVRRFRAVRRMNRFHHTEELRMDTEPTLTPLKAIRAKCLDCSTGSRAEVEHCPITDCPLYPYRKGRNPYRKSRQLTATEREILCDRMKALREKRLGQS